MARDRCAILNSASGNSSSPLALKKEGDGLDLVKNHANGVRDDGQGLLDFQYKADSSSHGLTSLAGLPLYLDLIKACGLGGAIQRHVRAAGGQGWLDIQMVLAVIS